MTEVLSEIGTENFSSQASLLIITWIWWRWSLYLSMTNVISRACWLEPRTRTPCCPCSRSLIENGCRVASVDDNRSIGERRRVCKTANRPRRLSWYNIFIIIFKLRGCIREKQKQCEHTSILWSSWRLEMFGSLKVCFSCQDLQIQSTKCQKIHQQKMPNVRIEEQQKLQERDLSLNMAYCTKKQHNFDDKKRVWKRSGKRL